MVRQAVAAVTTVWRVPLDKRRVGATSWRYWVPTGLVATSVLINLVVLRAETTQVPNLNDGALHTEMMQTALQHTQQGQLPLGGWFPYLGLGSAQFLHYQTFPHVVGALFATVFGTANVYYWSLYLLLAFWPVSVYVGGRLLGWDRWIAAVAALLSPLLVSVAGYGYEDSSYTWSGFGLWPQLWAMWLLPLAWGLSWRAVDRGRGYALAALVIALTIACHFMNGYLALLVLVPWVLLDPSQIGRRLIRAVVVGGGALLIASWVLVPLLSRSAWSGNLEYFQGTFYTDSYGAPKVLSWLFTGQLYDSGRFPIVSLLVGVGLVVCLSRLRRDMRARALVGAWTLILVLYFGRPTLGPLLDILPGGGDLQLQRLVGGVHLAGLMLAGVGAMWLVRALLAAIARSLPHFHVTATGAAIAVAGVALLFPAWSQVANSNANGAELMAAQQQADSADGRDLAVLINQVKAAGDGRAYAGTRTNWGYGYTVGYTPVYLELENAGIDAVGQGPNTQSLSSDVEEHFDESNLSDYDLFNVKYLILPQGHPPPVPAYLLARSGRHTLWEVATTGYMEVVDTVSPPIVADRTDIGPQTAAFLESNGLRRLQFPTVAFNGAAAAPPTLLNAGASVGSPGTVTDQSSELEDGVFSGQVTASRRAVVLLKTTDEPGWQVSVDGASAQPIMVAPSFVGVVVPAGSHTVVFRFTTYPYYPELLGVGFVTFLALLFVPRRMARRVRAVSDGPRARNELAANRASVASDKPRARHESAAKQPREFVVGDALGIKRWRTRRPMRYAAWALVLATILALGVAGIVNLTTSQPDSVQAAAYVNAGLSAQTQGRVAEAVEDYRRALAHDPRNKFAYYDLGTIEQQQGPSALNLAYSDYAAALQIDGKFAPALYNQAVLLTPSYPNQAVSLYQHVIQLTPGNATAHLNLGFLLLSLGRDEEARAEFATALHIEPALAARIPTSMRPSS